MSDPWWKLLIAIGVVFVLYETVQGWRTGKIGFRELQGDRKEAPAAYWFLMGINGFLLIAFVFAVLGIYGELN